MWVGRGTLALSSGVPWCSGAAGVENMHGVLYSIKPKIHLDIIIIAFTTEEHYIMWINVFLCTSPIFSLPAARFFSCSRLQGTQGARPTAQVWALAEFRGTCSGGSKSQVTTGRHSENVEPSRPIQTHVQVKKMSEEFRMSFRILLTVALIACPPCARARVHPVLMLGWSSSCSCWSAPLVLS